jgi:hypothetical protein
VGDGSGVTCFLCWKLVIGLSAARHAHVLYTACQIIHVCVRMLDSGI